MRLTRGGDLGRALGRAVLWAEIWAVSWVLLLAGLWVELLRLFEPRSSPPPHAAGCNSSELVAPPLAATANRAWTNGTLFLRFFEPPALSPSGEAAREWATGRTREL